jgi:hypothetical protein
MGYVTTLYFYSNDEVDAVDIRDKNPKLYSSIDWDTSHFIISILMMKLMQ